MVILIGLIFGSNLCTAHSSKKVCPDSSKCKCYTAERLLRADCSHHNIREELPNVPNNTTYLDLSYNKIHTLHYHTLFPPSLKYLDLSYNRLTCIYPGVFDKLTNLTRLKMNHNYLSFTDNVFKVHEARLNKSDCNLRKVRVEFPINTHVLDLSYNGIHMLNAKNKLPSSLELLDLSYNNISWICLGAFSELINLIWLNLNHNNLSYTESVFTPGIFLPLKNLQYLFIKDNCMDCGILPNISFYPETIAELENLIGMAIDTYRFALFPSSFQNLAHFTKLDMSCPSGLLARAKCKHGSGFCKHDIGPSFFQHTLKLEIVNISGCDLRYIANGAFSILHNLRFLNVSNNRRLSFRALKNITFGLANTQIDTLDISWLHCEYGVTTMIYKEDIESLKNTSLKVLNINSNRLVRIESGALRYLPHTIQTISASQNELQPGMYLLNFGNLSNLRYLDISRKPHAIPDLENDNMFGTCHDFRCDILQGKSMKEEETVTLGIRPKLKHKFIFPLPQNLKVLMLSNAAMQMSLPNVHFSENNKITEMELKNNLFTTWVGPFGPFRYLKHLDLSSNYCHAVSVYFFDRMTNISRLHINDNFLGFWFENDESADTFKQLKKLKWLDISRNRIRYMPHRIFSSQTVLRTLNLSYNIIGKLNISISHMHHLHRLDLSNNLLTTLSYDTRKQIDEIRHYSPELKIMLHANPLQCSCDQLDALKWFLSHRNSFVWFNKYICRHENDTDISFEHLHKLTIAFERECPSYLGVLFCAISFFSLAISFVVGGFSYRYRWKIRYMYYIFKSKQEITNQHQYEQLYDYNAFVSYSEKQRSFVIDELLLRLETEHEMRLCLHDRDFIPGKDIATNITSSIHRSRKTLIILSKSFLESNWCMFEFNMARMEEIYAREGRQSVIYIVLYENIPTKMLPLQILELIERQSYIEFPNDEQGNIVFWNKLVSSLVN